MIIETKRLRFVDLTLSDISKIAEIARDMAWFDTIQLLFRKDLTEENFLSVNEGALLDYKNDIISKAETICEKNVEEFQREDMLKVFYSFTKDTIPEEYWHINFSQLKPDFKKSAAAFVQGAMKRKDENPRTGFWLGIVEKQTNALIGATTISARAIAKEDVYRIGHSGQFIHPDFQRKGYISETKAVMVDFLYKYLLDMRCVLVPEKNVFYTTCHELNQGSAALQSKSGARPVGYIEDSNKIEFYADREDLLNSRLMNKPILWKALLDDGKVLTSKVTKKDMNIYYSIAHLRFYSPRD